MAEGHGRGWCVSCGFQPPRAGFHQRCPSLPKEGSLGLLLVPLAIDQVHESVKFLFSLAPRRRGEGVRG